GLELRAGFGARSLGRKAGRIVLLARDREGYESLCRIISARRAARARIDDEPIRCLDARPTGVFFLSDDPRVIDALLEAGIARDDVRFLLVRPGGAAAPRHVRALADTDVVMLAPEDRGLH